MGSIPDAGFAVRLRCGSVRLRIAVKQVTKPMTNDNSGSTEELSDIEHGENMAETDSGQNILYAIEDGARTNTEIHEHPAVQTSKSHMTGMTKSISQSYILEREKVGRAYEYSPGTAFNDYTPTETPEGVKNAERESEAESESEEQEQVAVEVSSVSESESEDEQSEAESEDEDGEDPYVATSDAEAWSNAVAGGQPMDGSEAMDAEPASESPDWLDTVAGEEPMPVDRSYDFGRAIPTDVNEYRQSNGELDRIMWDIKDRENHGRLPRYLIGGPTACGKTLMAKHVAQELQIPLFVIQCNHGMRQSSLVGQMAHVNGETKWIDSVMPRALIASQEGPVMVLIDEMNRAPSEYKDTFFSFLDDRCEVQIPELGQTIRGDPNNLITMATINQGPGYVGTEAIDPAELRRYGNMFKCDYLGVENPDAEVDLLESRTPVTADFADRLVTVANEIRSEARNGGSVKMGLPTGKTLDWAKTSASKNEAPFDPVDGPGVESAIEVFVDEMFDNNDTERNYVMDSVEDHLRGVSMDEDEQAENAAEQDDVSLESISHASCDECGFEAETSEVDDSMLAMNSCPECSGLLVLD